ncbi:MAG TPA: DUF1524 domain-containing protein [Microvirga sp.]|nr:DUF1524 domain-containing protein [Microvirga sp.]
MARPRSRNRRRFGLKLSIVAVLAVALPVVWWDRTHGLPEPFSVVVRQVELKVLDPLLRELELALSKPDLPPVVPDEGLDIARTRTLLAAIRVEPERTRGYLREDWPHWLDIDGDCLNTREEVLVAESLEPVRLSRDGCRVVRGRWLDRYTGETITVAAELDVDHVVALEEAHQSGGHAWSRERRAAFANDLSDARTLLAVSAAANRAKGSQGPEEWLPPAAGYRCRHVADWVAIKARWGLTMDERERVSVGNLVEACDGPSSATASVGRR